MTLGEMLTALYDDLNSQAGTVVTARYTRWLNEGYQKILRMPALTELRHGTLSFATVANQSLYAIPQAFTRVDEIVQESNNVRLQYRTLDWFRALDPGNTANGNPYVWISEGLQQVYRQPDSTGIWVASSNAADTTQVIKFNGTTANGDQQAQQTSAAITGVTRLAIGTITSWSNIQKWESSAVGVGTISLYDAVTAGNELARLPIGRTSVQYQAIRLWPTPAQVLTYKIDGQLLFVPLLNVNDVPALPEDFADMLPCYARFREYKKQGDQERMAAELSEWQTWLGRVQSVVEYPADYRPVSGSMAEDFRWNNLGAWYPGDGWGR